MKPLIAILLLAVSVQAQTLADAARKERQRQASLKPVRVLSVDGRQTATPAADAISLNERPASNFSRAISFNFLMDNLACAIVAPSRSRRATLRGYPFSAVPTWSGIPYRHRPEHRTGMLRNLVPAWAGLRSPRSSPSRQAPA